MKTQTSAQKKDPKLRPPAEPPRRIPAAKPTKPAERQYNLENSIDKVVALLEMFSEKVWKDRDSQSDKDVAGSAASGMVLLTLESIRELKSAFDRKPLYDEGDFFNMLGLTSYQRLAVARISEWEGQSPAEYCRRAILSSLRASYEDLSQIAEGKDRKAEVRDRALVFYDEVKPLFATEGGVR